MNKALYALTLELPDNIIRIISITVRVALDDEFDTEQTIKTDWQTLRKLGKKE